MQAKYTNRESVLIVCRSRLFLLLITLFLVRFQMKKVSIFFFINKISIFVVVVIVEKINK